MKKREREIDIIQAKIDILLWVINHPHCDYQGCQYIEEKIDELENDKKL